MLRHYYQGERISHFPDQIRQNCPLFGSGISLQLLYCERYRGDRKKKLFTSHEHWELTAVAAGSGELILENGSSLNVTEDTLLLIPPGIRHYEQAVKRMDLCWLGFKLNLSQEYCSGHVRVLESHTLLEATLNIWEMLLLGTPGSGLELDGKLLSLIGAFLRLESGHSRQSRVELGAALNFLNNNPTATISVPELAALCNMSQSFFYREFKKLTSQTPVHYQQTQRMNLAELCLRETDLPVIEIAKRCGFRDQFYFTRLFTCRHGVSPLKFRNMLLTQESLRQ